MISETQRTIMYRGLATKGRLVADAEECAKIDAQLSADPKNYYLWCARAVVCGNLEQAIEAYSQALSLRPFSPHTLYNRARKYMSQGRYIEALSDFVLSTTLDQEDGWKWHFQGVALYFLNRFDEAAESFSRAIEAHASTGEEALPFEVEWIWNCCMKNGEPDRAEQALQLVTSQTPCVESEITYLYRILLYRDELSVENFLAKLKDYDILEQANMLYGTANYYYYIKHDVKTSVEYLRQVLAKTEAKLCWGYKMAVRDLPLREAILSENHME